MTTETGPVLSERQEDGVALVRIDRPKARNALDMATRRALAAAFEALHDDPSVRAIVLTGNEQAFAAGADLREFVDAGPIEILQRRAERYWSTIARTPWTRIPPTSSELSCTGAALSEPFAVETVAV